MCTSCWFSVKRPPPLYNVSRVSTIVSKSMVPSSQRSVKGFWQMLLSDLRPPLAYANAWPLPIISGRAGKRTQYFNSVLNILLAHLNPRRVDGVPRQPDGGRSYYYAWPARWVPLPQLTSSSVVMCSSSEWHGVVSLGLCVGIDMLGAAQLAERGAVRLAMAEDLGCDGRAPGSSRMTDCIAPLACQLAFHTW